MRGPAHTQLAWICSPTYHMCPSIKHNLCICHTFVLMKGGVVMSICEAAPAPALGICHKQRHACIACKHAHARDLLTLGACTAQGHAPHHHTAHHTITIPASSYHHHHTTIIIIPSSSYHHHHIIIIIPPSSYHHHTAHLSCLSAAPPQHMQARSCMYATSVYNNLFRLFQGAASGGTPTCNAFMPSESHPPAMPSYSGMSMIGNYPDRN